MAFEARGIGARQAPETRPAGPGAGRAREKFNRAAPPDSGVSEELACPRCGVPMKRMQVCHMFCTNCGAHLDCSDKGSYW